MNIKGFFLIETLMGLFLLGIIVITCLPILNIGINNISMTKEKMQMLFIAESIIEQIKAFDDNWKDDQYIFDMNIRELIDILRNSKAVSVRLPLDNKNKDYKYHCIINKENTNNDLWEIHLVISPMERKNRIKSIDIRANVIIPEMGEI